MAATDPFGLRGHVLDGQFRVDDFIGEGGFSVVYRGTHIGLSEPVAVKCLKLPPALGSALVESFIKRFRDESRLHYRLSQGHLHIARCIASGTTVAPATSALVPYTTLEWLDGRTLSDELEERRRRGLRGRPLGEVVRLLDSAVDALAYAHAQGVVHRDLNPGNLFLTKTPAGIKLKVLDFGVAKILADSALAMGPGAHTLGNVRIFTPSYGAPEQFDDGVGAIGPWTDVYAVALVVLEALTDRTAMEGEHIGELAAKALDPHRRPTPRAFGVSIGDEAENALARAVALSPADRPRDAGELWGLLKHAMAEDEAAERSRGRSHEPRAGRSSPSSPASPAAPGPVVESPRPASGSDRAFGGTLRMSNAPGGTAAQQGSWGSVPVPEGGPAVLADSENGSGAASGDPAPVSVGPRAGVKRARSSVVVVIVLAILVLGALAFVWLLSPRGHAATSPSFAAPPAAPLASALAGPLSTPLSSALTMAPG